MPRERLQRIAKRLDARGIHTGGPVGGFERIGRMHLRVLLREGLYPWHKVLEIGCCALRGGYWLIHFLDPGCYCGIEPDIRKVEIGKRYFLEEATLAAKRPRFDANDCFDASMFDEQFDFFVSRSTWTHASKDQVEAMLDMFVKHTHRVGVFLTSYVRPDRKHLENKSMKWRAAVMGAHSFAWIQSVCKARSLAVRELTYGRNRGSKGQIWLRITRAKA